MRFLIVGLGSMGKRRIRNLLFLKADGVSGFDSRDDRRRESKKAYDIDTFDSFERAMDSGPDALIISTPPDMHMKYALEAARQNIHFFTEASVLADGMDRLIEILRDKKIVAAPSCTMRFHPSVRKLKSLVETSEAGRPVAFTHHCGQYLPDWHPWEDYTKYYVARRETGGCREIVPFELIWLTWIFGEPEALSCFKDKLSNLKADIDDVYQILLRFRTKILGHMLIDVVSRVPYRSFRLLCEEGVITWEWGEAVKVYSAASKTWKQHQEEKGTTVEGYADKIKEEPYIEEMRCFINAIEGKDRFPYTFEEDRKALEMLYSAERSSDEGVHINM